MQRRLSTLFSQLQVAQLQVALLVAITISAGGRVNAQTSESDSSPLESVRETQSEDQPSAAAATESAESLDPEPANPEPANAEPANAEPADAEPAGEQPLADAPGQSDFEKAVELKLNARSPRDLNKVIELLDEALEVGVNERNEAFAELVLMSTLLYRGKLLSAEAIKKPSSDASSRLRWLQLRQLALSDLQRVVEIDPKQGEAHLLVGRLYSLKYFPRFADVNAARRALGKALKHRKGLSPEQLAQAYALRGDTQQDPKKRLADFHAAIENDSSKVEYLLLRAREHQRLGDSDSAVADIDKVLQQTPNNTDAHQLKALVLLTQGQTEEAIASFDRVTELNPKDINPYLLRAEAYNRIDQTAEAIEQLNKAIAIEPAKPETRLLRAQLYLIDDQPEAALADVELVLARQPGSLRGHLMRVQVLEKLGRREEAVDALERISQAAADRPEILLQLASMYHNFKAYEQAIDVLSRVIDQAADNLSALRLRGDMYLSVGNHSEALADFARAYELSPDDSSLLNNYAWTLATSPFDELRDGKRAIELATRAAELTEFEQPHILSTLAAAYAETGKFDRAVEISEQALDLERAVDETSDEALEDRPTLDSQLSSELASYRARKPWRELQQEGDAVESLPETDEPTFDPELDQAGVEEPDRAFDF